MTWGSFVRGISTRRIFSRGASTRDRNKAKVINNYLIYKYPLCYHPDNFGIIHYIPTKNPYNSLYYRIYPRQKKKSANDIFLL